MPVSYRKRLRELCEDIDEFRRVPSVDRSGNSDNELCEVCIIQRGSITKATL